MGNTPSHSLTATIVLDASVFLVMFDNQSLAAMLPCSAINTSPVYQGCCGTPLEIRDHVSSCICWTGSPLLGSILETSRWLACRGLWEGRPADCWGLSGAAGNCLGLQETAEDGGELRGTVKEGG